MSFNNNHIINLANYEEWFVLYMDNELNADEKAMVENFLLLHPHLQEEMNVLLSTKLPTDEIIFSGKEELHANAMKLNAVDDSLLLYIDNELSSAEQKAVEEKLRFDKDYQLQFSLLQQTKVEASEAIPYPNKKELYRHTEKVIFFPFWMRIAVAVVIVLFASLFFVLNTTKQAANNGYAVKVQPATQKNVLPPSNNIEQKLLPQQQSVAVNTTVVAKKINKPESKAIAVLLQKRKSVKENTITKEQMQTASVDKVEPIKINVSKLTEQPSVAVNNISATPVVTSVTPVSYNSKNPDETVGSDGDEQTFKRTPAKGFLRKVSRFIERRTGIGTVNADNQLLVGSVALKLN